MAVVTICYLHDCRATGHKTGLRRVPPYRSIRRLDPYRRRGCLLLPSTSRSRPIASGGDASDYLQASEDPNPLSRIHRSGEVLCDKYAVQGLLGSGGNGIIFKCTRISDDKMVAVKMLSLRSAGSWKQIELFEREAQVLRQLSHPSIPSYVDSFEIDTETDRRFYIVQELADGVSLAHLIQKGVRFSEDEIKRIALQMLELVLYLSKLQPPVIHRDIKPENVIIHGGETGGRVYLVDFGGVQGTESLYGTSSTIVGTYGYMAPEQFRGIAETKSDLYGLGATLLFLISGRQPTSFSQERLKIQFSDNVSTSPELSMLLDALLEPLPEDRVNAEEAIAILKQEEAVGIPEWIRKKGVLRRRRKPPAGARSRIIRRTANNLEIEIPAAGFSGINMATGTFAIAWNAFVLFWSYSALISGGILPLLFSIPFWYAGAEITKISISSSLMQENLKINATKFSLTKELSFLKTEDGKEFEGGLVIEDSRRARNEVKGRTADLSRAEIVTSVIVNGSPQTCIQLKEGVRTHVFAEGLTRVEQEWLLEEINDVIENAT